jgi:hypothetical protein
MKWLKSLVARVLGTLFAGYYRRYCDREGNFWKFWAMVPVCTEESLYRFYKIYGDIKTKTVTVDKRVQLVAYPAEMIKFGAEYLFLLNSVDGKAALSVFYAKE